MKWFGASRPSDEAVAKEERRVQYFKHQGSLLDDLSKLEEKINKAPEAFSFFLITPQNNNEDLLGGKESFDVRKDPRFATIRVAFQLTDYKVIADKSTKRAHINLFMDIEDELPELANFIEATGFYLKDSDTFFTKVPNLQQNLVEAKLADLIKKKAQLRLAKDYIGAVEDNGSVTIYDTDNAMVDSHVNHGLGDAWDKFRYMGEDKEPTKAFPHPFAKGSIVWTCEPDADSAYAVEDKIECMGQEVTGHYDLHSGNYITPRPVTTAQLSLGDCRNEEVISELFGSVTDFARLVEEYGNNFIYKGIIVKYNPKTDIHTFYSHKTAQSNNIQNLISKENYKNTIPKEHLSGVNEIAVENQEEGKGGYFLKDKISLMPEYDARVLAHEIGHNVFRNLPNKSEVAGAMLKSPLFKALNKSNLAEKYNYDPERFAKEVFAEYYAAYATGETKYGIIPQVVEDVFNTTKVTAQSNTEKADKLLAPKIVDTNSRKKLIDKVTLVNNNLDPQDIVNNVLRIKQAVTKSQLANILASKAIRDYIAEHTDKPIIALADSIKSAPSIKIDNKMTEYAKYDEKLNNITVNEVRLEQLPELQQESILLHEYAHYLQKFLNIKNEKQIGDTYLEDASEREAIELEIKYFKTNQVPKEEVMQLMTSTFPQDMAKDIAAIVSQVYKA